MTTLTCSKILVNDLTVTPNGFMEHRDFVPYKSTWGLLQYMHPKCTFLVKCRKGLNAVFFRKVNEIYEVKDRAPLHLRNQA